jgi:hypothetical protein
MLPLRLFRLRNFTFANIETFAVYAALSTLTFFLVLFLQQLAGYSPFRSGLATVPITIVMFFLSPRVGRLSMRFGPRYFMGIGPLVGAAALVWVRELTPGFSYWTALLPPLVVFSIGLSLIVAPLTSTVLADAGESDAGIASGVNNAIARVAGLLATAAIGAVVAASFASSLDSRLAARPLGAPARAAIADVKRQPLGRPSTAGLPPAEGRALSAAAGAASVRSFHIGLGIAAALVALGGILGGFGIRNPRRRVVAEHCSGGQLAGAARDAAGCPEGRSAEPLREPVTA